MQQACCRGQLEVVRGLVEQGVDRDEPDAVGWAPLSVAALADQPEVVAYLLESGVNVNPSTPSGVPWLDRVVMRSRHPKMVKGLLKAGATPSPTILHAAVKCQQEEMLQVLLEWGINTEGQDEAGKTALWWAHRCTFPEGVRLLLQYGAVLDEEMTTMYRTGVIRRTVVGTVFPTLEKLERATDPDHVRLTKCREIHHLRYYLSLRHPIERTIYGASQSFLNPAIGKRVSHHHFPMKFRYRNDRKRLTPDMVRMVIWSLTKQIDSPLPMEVVTMILDQLL